MAPEKFDAESFFAALEAAKIARAITWKKVAEEADVPASTLTRMSQGRRPDVDSLAGLCGWSGLRVEDFTRSGQKKNQPDALAQMMLHLRADPNLSDEGATALEGLLKAAYKHLRKK